MMAQGRGRWVVSLKPKLIQNFSTEETAVFLKNCLLDWNKKLPNFKYKFNIYILPNFCSCSAGVLCPNQLHQCQIHYAGVILGIMGTTFQYKRPHYLVICIPDVLPTVNILKRENYYQWEKRANKTLHLRFFSSSMVRRQIATHLKIRCPQT